MFSASRSSLNVLRTKIGQSTCISTARVISGQRLKYSVTTKATAALCSKAVRHQPIFGANRIHRFHASAIANAKLPFLLADIGEGITECEVIQWFVKVGDKVEEFDRLCEVQSDKASVEITSRFTGTIATLKYKVGEMAKVGSPLVEIETGDAEPAVEEAVVAPDATSASKPAPEDGLRGHSNVIQDMTAVAAMMDNAPGKAEKLEVPTAEHILTFATPAVRRVAKENDVDISLIKGSGKGGRVMKEDVMTYLANGRQSTAAPKTTETLGSAKTVIPKGEDKVLPLNMIQKAMFKQMTKSLSIPHFGFADEIVLDNAIAFRTALNDHVAKAPEKYNFKKLSYMPVFIKALSVALEQYPIMNACLVDGDDALTAKLKYRASHNIGIAMDTPNGLIVPNIKNVQNLSILEIASELTRLQEAGKKNAIPLADLKDGTISLSNVGMIGGTYLNPVVVTSEVAIAAVGKVQRLPRFKMIEQDDGTKAERVVAQQVVNVSWSADHRVIDGATIARFSQVWKDVIENPFLLGAMLR